MKPSIHENHAEATAVPGVPIPPKPVVFNALAEIYGRSPSWPRRSKNEGCADLLQEPWFDQIRLMLEIGPTILNNRDPAGLFFEAIDDSTRLSNGPGVRVNLWKTLLTDRLGPNIVNVP